jgi:hypothetical protein
VISLARLNMAPVVLLGRLQLPLLLHSQICQDLGIVSSRCDNLMASGTVIGDGLAIGTRVRAIMASEAARRIDVPEVIRVCAPGHSHVWENVA